MFFSFTMTEFIKFEIYIGEITQNYLIVNGFYFGIKMLLLVFIIMLKFKVPMFIINTIFYVILYLMHCFVFSFLICFSSAISI